MPIYDMLCDECERLIENEFLTFAEFDLMKEAGGMPCPDCPGMMHTKPSRVGFTFAPTRDAKGHLYPGDKAGLRHLMDARYAKRNERMEKLPPDQKDRMVRFMERFGVRKTAPPAPDHR